MKLSGNTVLITGGGSGIGLELAKQLRERENEIIITGRDAAKLEKAKSAVPGLHVFQSDVSKPSDIDALFEKVVKEFPKLNVLINNAGIMKRVNLHDASVGLEEITREVETNLSGTIRMVHRFLPHLKSQPASAIVNVTSGLAFVPLPTSPIYCATKAALHSYTQSLRVQLQRTNVRVFELAPPATDTEMLTSTSSPEDLRGVSVMRTDSMVEEAIKEMERDRLEIRPGQANQLKFMSRLAPDFILKQLSKPVDRMLAGMKD
jgi:uncharacterized oxidoreductase